MEMLFCKKIKQNLHSAIAAYVIKVLNYNQPAGNFAFFCLPISYNSSN